MGQDKGHSTIRPKFTNNVKTAEAQVWSKLSTALAAALRREQKAGSEDHTHSTAKPRFSKAKRTIKTAGAAVRRRLSSALRNAVLNEAYQTLYGCSKKSAEGRRLPMPKVTVKTPECQELIEHHFRSFTFPTEGDEQYKLENATTKCYLTGLDLRLNEISLEHLVEASKGGTATKDNWVIIAKPLNSLQQYRKNSDPETWKRLRAAIQKFLDLDEQK